MLEHVLDIEVVTRSSLHHYTYLYVLQLFEGVSSAKPFMDRYIRRK